MLRSQHTGPLLARSPLADRYLCERCRGYGYGEKQIDVDEFIDVNCPDCDGTGADCDSPMAAYIDDWLACNDITVSTHNEHRLRELLISTAAGHDSWGERDEPGGNPIVAMPERDEIDTFISDLANALQREGYADSGREHGIYNAYGRMQAVMTRLLLSVSHGEPLSTAIQRERALRETCHTEADDSGAGIDSEAGGAVSPLLSRDTAVDRGRCEPAGHGIGSADAAGQPHDRSRQVATAVRGSLLNEYA